MPEQPFIINRETKKLEKATGLEEYTVDIETIFSEEDINLAIDNYFISQPTGEQIWITDEIIVGEDDLEIKFTNLYTNNGATRLPLKIKNAKVFIAGVYNDSDVFVHSGSETERGFTVSRKAGRSEDRAKVRFKITGVEIQ